MSKSLVIVESPAKAKTISISEKTSPSRLPSAALRICQEQDRRESGDGSFARANRHPGKKKSSTRLKKLAKATVIYRL